MIKLCPIISTTTTQNGKLKSTDDAYQHDDLESDDIMTEYTSESSKQQEHVLMVCSLFLFFTFF